MTNLLPKRFPLLPGIPALPGDPAPADATVPYHPAVDTSDMSELDALRESLSLLPIVAIEELL